MADYGLSAYDASVLVAERETADFFESGRQRTAASKRDAKAVANWLMGDLSAQANAQGVSVAEAGLAAASLAALVDLIGEGVISGKIAKDLLVMLLGDDQRRRSARARRSARTAPGDRHRRDRRRGRRGHRRQSRQGRAGQGEARHARLVRRSGDEDDRRQGQSAGGQRRVEDATRTLSARESRAAISRDSLASHRDRAAFVSLSQQKYDSDAEEKFD